MAADEQRLNFVLILETSGIDIVNLLLLIPTSHHTV